ncbi:hypothetical protein [Aliarcobacter butzleri]|uniref:hypothetical protein n=1 Tax=Aliarcobacter butzleri TaxID=28197 RepID=UPI001ED9D8F2|nr:hypothetical protein [Aliarcobacter butzleri]MCG3692839.1 hypothetical protein [Aliarcobacter butzleri]
MDEIKLNIKLRPIRFVFLVKPTDKENILKIFQINTFLWGGKFNPIIPFFKKVPKWWNENYKSYNSQQILDNYLDFFEPDFIVEAEKGLADDIVFDRKRILQLDNLLTGDEYGAERYGLNVNDLYIHLYEKKYQFERRHKLSIVNVKAKEKYLQPFISCLFGSFIKDEEFSYLEKNYIDIFEPNEIQLNGNSLAEIYKSQYFAPLDIGHVKIDIQYHDRTPNPRLFVLDIKEIKDLIDYWNLRIIYREVIPIPKQWLTELSSFCKEFIIKNYRSHPMYTDNTYMLHTTTMFSRSISKDEATKIYDQYIKVDNPAANYIQHWYPDIKLEQSDWIAGIKRPILKYNENKKEINLSDSENKQIHFETLAPDFAKKYDNKIRWANIINIKDWSFKNQIATNFPTNYRNPLFPKFSFYGEILLPTSEGLTIFPQYIDSSHRWNLVNGTRAINKWLVTYGIKATVSDAGKSTQQIIETIGGVSQIFSLTSKNVIEQLNKMANTPLTRSFQINKFENEINKKMKKNPYGHTRSEILVSQKIVELGLELKCSKCDSWNWYTIDSLNYNLTCNRCLKTYAFPITKPTNSDFSRWAYRVIGAFALPDYARGGYSASLAIHFFERNIASAHDLDITWSGGQELTLNSGEKAEADFILWTQKKETLDLNKPTDIVFGEAKSFAKDAFKDSDVQKMKLLAETFPKSILVFATMKDYEDFSADEIVRLKKLAEWGRGYDNENKEIRAYIMILTGLELFIEDYGGLSRTWEQKGGRHKELISGIISHKLDNLKLLSELTQQLYLNMPSYYDGLQNLK